MAGHMKPQDWLQVIRTEYLQDFVRRGGAAVKFVVPVGGIGPSELQSGLKSAAEQEGYCSAFVDSADTKIHLIDQLFFQVARQMDWEQMAYAFLRQQLKDHYRLPDSLGEFNLAQIAALNARDEAELRPLINNRLRGGLFRDYHMTQEFRIAMVKLCQYQLDPVEVGQDLHNAMKDWLTGDLRLVSALKSALIFQKIARHNARHMLYSLSHWLRLTGKSGLVLMLDISRYTQQRPKDSDGGLYYSKPALLQCYEVLRQFIDGTDEAEFLLSVVLAPPRFVTLDESRSVAEYDALRLRIWDEVHDRVYVNPLSSLVRVSACSQSIDCVGR